MSLNRIPTTTKPTNFANQSFAPVNQSNGFAPVNQGSQSNGFAPVNQGNQGFAPVNQGNGFAPVNQGNQGFPPVNQGFAPVTQSLEAPATCANQFTDGVNRLITDILLVPLVDFINEQLRLGRNQEVTVEECRTALNLPYVSTVNRTAMTPKTSFTSLATAKTTTRKSATPALENPVQGKCCYRYTKGKNAGFCCGASVQPGEYMCVKCIKTKTGQKQLEQMGISVGTSYVAPVKTAGFGMVQNPLMNQHNYQQPGFQTNTMPQVGFQAMTSFNQPVMGNRTVSNPATASLTPVSAFPDIQESMVKDAGEDINIADYTVANYPGDDNLKIVVHTASKTAFFIFDVANKVLGEVNQNDHSIIQSVGLIVAGADQTTTQPTTNFQPVNTQPTTNFQPVNTQPSTNFQPVNTQPVNNPPSSTSNSTGSSPVPTHNTTTNGFPKPNLPASNGFKLNGVNNILPPKPNFGTNKNLVPESTLNQEEA